MKWKRYFEEKEIGRQERNTSSTAIIERIGGIANA